ncbi:MAG: monomeric [FeFe] hydrogenase [Deltaproteobacteria bacterium]|jgi:[FeFe] hydrogenase (group B1/B3)|nr:monomeric [FeFe] hydrogenase [Deltaproteobacteria bacterium]
MSRQTIHLKKEVLVRIIKAFFSGDFINNIRLVPFQMRPKGSDVSYRCCIYKERAVLRDRIISGLGFGIENDDETLDLGIYAEQALKREKPEDIPLTVIETACKGCTPNRIHITDLCQGCVARPCQSTCRFGAISIINGKSVIDGAKCKNCKMCVPVCPYNAIVKISVPCEDSCPVAAIQKNAHGFAQIDYDKCITCGKCIIGCPFGAVHEKSQLIDVLKNLNKKIIALIAPSIVGQFPGNIYQLKSAMLKLGFSDVYEVAQGADITTKNEALEFKERLEKGEPLMTTSCCAGYFNFVEKHLPEIKRFVSDTKTPLYYIAEQAKARHPDAVTVFISPCTAKKSEAHACANVDYVLNYEELGAVFVALNMEITACEQVPFDTESSREGRAFGITGGVAAAVASISEIRVNPCIINGLNKDSIKRLRQIAREGRCPPADCAPQDASRAPDAASGCNLVEVMCCENGCIGGNAAIAPEKISKKALADFLKMTPAADQP